MPASDKLAQIFEILVDTFDSLGVGGMLVREICYLSVVWPNGNFYGLVSCTDLL